MGRVRCAPIPADGRDGELAGGHVDVRPGGHGEVLRGSRGDAAGTELGSSFVERVVSEHGNRSGPCPVPRFQRGCSGWVHRRPIGPGRGGAAVVLRVRESRTHGEGRQQFREGMEAVMPKDAPPNGGAPPEDEPFIGPRRRVSEMQAKLHRWAAADPGRRFDDLFNFVHDPATLIVAFDRVAGNTGSRTPGVDGLTVADVEEVIGVPGFLDDLHARLKAGTFAPPVSYTHLRAHETDSY